jgi:hypothetical protein
LITFCPYGFTPTIFRPLFGTPGSSAPINVPMTEPRPPGIAVRGPTGAQPEPTGARGRMLPTVEIFGATGRAPPAGYVNG